MISRQNGAVAGDDNGKILQLGGPLADEGSCRLQCASAEIGDLAAIARVEPLAEVDCDLDSQLPNAPLLQPLARVGADHERWMSCPAHSFARGHKSDIAALIRPSCFEHGLTCRDAGSPLRGSGSGDRRRTDSIWSMQPRFACGLRGR